MSTGWERRQVQPVMFAGSQSGCLMQEKTGDQVEWIWFMQGNFACDCWFWINLTQAACLLTCGCTFFRTLNVLFEKKPSKPYISKQTPLPHPQDTKALLHVPSQGSCWFGVCLLLLSWVFYVHVKAPAAWKQLLKSFTGNGRHRANKAGW